jgi:alkaline phosphatase D
MLEDGALRGSAWSGVAGCLVVWLLLCLPPDGRVGAAEPTWVPARRVEAFEAHQAAAADAHYFYAITNSQVARYDRSSGQRVDSSTGAALHLNSGFLFQGRLYCAHSNYPRLPEHSEIKVLDLESMELDTFHDFGESDGSLTWAVRHEDHWWCNFAYYDDQQQKSYVVQFDEAWQELRRWTYPAALLRRLGNYSLSGGLFLDGLLVATGHDERELYRLRVPAESGELQFLGTERIPFTGQGFSLDPLTGGLIGIDRARKQLILARPPAAELDPATQLHRIHFGSCIKQDQPMPIFETMLADHPQLALFLGDNIYADTEDMQLMRSKYQRLAANPGFQSYRSQVPSLATWDDHDYGANDGGCDYPQRAASQQVFLDFWNDPEASPRRQREGIYDARTFGPPGRRVQVILLDTRYFRSPLLRGPTQQVGGPWIADVDPKKTMLGQTQWEWLAEQLKQPAELRLLVSSIQLASSTAGHETWSNLPVERARLQQLIRDTRAAGVVVLSGDRHWSELSIVEDGVGYPLYDLTSSSFNQPHPRGTPTDNSRRALPTTYHQQNYGAVEIDWDAPSPTVSLQIRDLAGQIVLERQLLLAELQPNASQD